MIWSVVGFGQQVAGQLLAGELIQRHVVVERIDHVIAIGRDVVVLVTVISNRVGESHQVQPIDCHAFTKRGRGKQADQHIGDKRPGTGIGQKPVELFLRGRQAGQVKVSHGESASPGQHRCRHGVSCAVKLVQAQNCPADRVARLQLLTCGVGCAIGRDVRPVSFVLGSGGDPLFAAFRSAVS